MITPELFSLQEFDYLDDLKLLIQDYQTQMEQIVANLSESDPLIDSVASSILYAKEFLEQSEILNVNIVQIFRMERQMHVMAYQQRHLIPERLLRDISTVHKPWSQDLRNWHAVHMDVEREMKDEIDPGAQLGESISRFQSKL